MGNKEIKGPKMNSGDYKMTPETNEKTLNGMRDKLDDAGKERFDQALDSGTGNRVKLIGSDSKFNMVSGSKGLASGNYLTPDDPGATPQEWQKNLQLPPSNDAARVNQVQSTRPQLGVISQIKPQPGFAKEAGYEAAPGVRQVYTPNNNPNGAIADGRYKVVDNHPVVSPEKGLTTIPQTGPSSGGGPNNPPGGGGPKGPNNPPGGGGPKGPNNPPDGGGPQRPQQPAGRRRPQRSQQPSISGWKHFEQQSGIQCERPCFCRFKIVRYCTCFLHQRR